MFFGGVMMIMSGSEAKNGTPMELSGSVFTSAPHIAQKEQLALKAGSLDMMHRDDNFVL